MSTTNGGNRFNYTTVTIEVATPSEPTISIAASDGLTGGGIQLTPSITGTYRPAYSYATVRNYNNTTSQTYYWTSTTEATTTQPGISDWSDSTLNWEITTGDAYASVNSDGLVTITDNPTGNIVVRLTVSKDGYSGNTSITITRNDVAQSTTGYTYSPISITPANATLDLNGTQVYAVSNTVTRYTNLTPAHTTLSVGGNTFYWHNNTLNTSAPEPSSTSTTLNLSNVSWSDGGGSSYYALDPYYSAGSNQTTLTRSALRSASNLAYTITATANYGGESQNLTATAIVNIPATFVDLDGISCPDITIPYGQTGTLNPNTWINSEGGKYENLTYTVADPTIASVDDNGVVTALNAGTTTVTIQSKRIDGSNGVSCAASITVTPAQLSAPTISVNLSTGVATITDDNGVSGAVIRYTTDGSDPTATTATTVANGGTVTLTRGQAIKAIVTVDGGNYSTSAIATDVYVVDGHFDGIVYLDDREDHNWSYYQPSSELPAGYPEQLHSPYPRNIKITYLGNGTNTVATSNDADPGNTFTASTNSSVMVGIDASEHTFIYYKTLERDANNRFPYEMIPNPFSVRPTNGTGDTRWRGFYKWRIKSITNGAVYTASTGGTALGVGSVLDAESTYYFQPADNAQSNANNAISMEIELEALWARAYVVTTNTATGLQASVGYERNFVVTTTGITAELNVPVTYSTYYPDGTGGSNNTVTLNNSTLNADTKFEYINLQGTGTITANNHYLCFGRGIAIGGTLENDNNATATLVQGINGNVTNLNYTIRMESGKYRGFAFVRNTGATVSGNYYVKAIMGCDYDRATGNNNLLSVSRQANLFFATSVSFSGNGNKDSKTFDLVVKSGQYQRAYWNNQDTRPSNSNNPEGGGWQSSFYCGQNQGTNNYCGIRYVVVEGGEFGCMNGGRGTNGNNDGYVPVLTTPSVTLRIKGGLFHGAVYGGAADSETRGSRAIIVTGGEIQSWIAGANNGTGTQTGSNAGVAADSWVYVGGNSLVGGDNAKVVNTTAGGQIFGAGRGLADQRASVINSYVVIADETEVKGANGGYVYGGGFNGFVTTVSNVYILGGTVGNSVFGGSYGNTGDAKTIPTANVTMTGGLVKGGVYGGSNSSGNVDNVTMHINGGQVGESLTSTANVHGGGYGQNTNVNGNVTLMLSHCDFANGPTIYGDVYGGSALGNVNAGTGNTTTVSLYKGTIYGGLYGGGLGSNTVSALVRGNVQVKVYGGSVLCNSSTDPDGVAGTGSVFGCNNVNGTPSGTVTVDIYNTDQPASGYALHAVYGGGNKAAYNNTPVVTIHGCSNSIEYVYGGGNATDVLGTDVTIWGGTIGSAFGGGNGAGAGNPGANITAEGTNLVIHGGTIGSVFGGSNERGKISSSVNVSISGAREPGEDPCTHTAYTECPMEINEMYSGGNKAELRDMGNNWIAPGNINVTTDCSTKINYLFGGARMADYGGGDITLTVNGGVYKQIFGGNNLDGEISGNVTVNFLGGKAEDIFGGNNMGGTVRGTITVNIDSTANSCDPDFYVENVYGGGNQAEYSHAAGNYPEVNVKNGTVQQDVYGGGLGAGATVTGSPKVTVGVSDTGKKALVLGNVFGGGNAASVSGDTRVNIMYNTYIKGNVYGGGNAAPVSGNTKVVVGE